ncbi:MAG: glycosyltransferase family 2 protein [Acidimicrobiales bacterium]
MSGNKDAYFVEASEFAQYDAAQQSFIQQGEVIELSGKSSNCAWDQSTAACARCNRADLPRHGAVSPPSVRTRCDGRRELIHSPLSNHHGVGGPYAIGRRRLRVRRADMAIHSICLVRDEADIIEHTLRHAAHWSNRIYVHDNGSTDGTWEIVLRLAAELPQVVPFRRDESPFDDALRLQAFRQFSGRATEGDWWCRLDADEVYIDDPRRFLDRIAPCFDTVWSASFQYYLTDLDVQRHRQDPAVCRRRAHRATVPVLPQQLVGGALLPPAPRPALGARTAAGAAAAHLSAAHPPQALPVPLTPAGREALRRPGRGHAAAGVRPRTAHRLGRLHRGPAGQRANDGAWAPRRWTERVLPAATLVADDGVHYEIDEGLLPPMFDLHPTLRRRVQTALERRHRPNPAPTPAPFEPPLAVAPATEPVGQIGLARHLPPSTL